MTEREVWTSRFSFIMAVLGFSIGIGNLWRFPYLVGRYGGGVFLAFYLFVVLFLTIPLFAVEITLGKATRQDPVGAYKTLAPRTPWVLNGYLNVATMILIAGYASPILGYVLAYAFKTAGGTFSRLSSADMAGYFGRFTANRPEVVAWTLATVIFLVLIVRRGLNKGVERANNLMLPALFLILVALVIRAVTLPGVAKGLAFYLRPDASKFTWEGAVAAIGQTYFAVGVAMATALVYGSYLPRESKNVVANSTIVVLASTAVAILAGLVIFPSVFSFGLDPDSGFGLTFITMPNVFNRMPAGAFFGTLFYILFFLAAVTSFIGGYEAIIAWLRDQHRIPRERGVWITGAGVMAIAVFSSASGAFFKAADYVANNIFLILGATLMAVFAGWVWKIPNFAAAAGVESRGAIRVWTLIVKYAAPLIMLVTWLSQLKVLDKLVDLWR
jgi:NSS family neurotransmitter:Na+ symporter